MIERGSARYLRDIVPPADSSRVEAHDAECVALEAVRGGAGCPTRGLRRPATFRQPSAARIAIRCRARRAVELGRDSSHPIATQARALEQRLARDLERDPKRRAAGQVTTKDLPPTRAVPILAAHDPMGLE